MATCLFVGHYLRSSSYSDEFRVSKKVFLTPCDNLQHTCFTICITLQPFLFFYRKINIQLTLICYWHDICVSKKKKRLKYFTEFIHIPICYEEWWRISLLHSLFILYFHNLLIRFSFTVDHLKINDVLQYSLTVSKMF